ncbi:hypothetical protein [Acinetobacter piscicola]|uniref:hypothetical protein n=1 Tax=Acinetobacter piscicola TaxID=2006115 RepID=UPI001E41CDC4|nr:hypothetical protein [Acinetobacter piscicola]
MKLLNFKRITIFLTSLLLILNSTLANAATLGAWTLSNPTAVGASILYDGLKGVIKSSVLIKPNATQVAKVLGSGGGGFALSYAVEQLLGAVDWVMDPANNRIKYNIDQNTNVCYYSNISSFNVNTYIAAQSVCKKFTSNVTFLSIEKIQTNRYQCNYENTGGIQNITFVCSATTVKEEKNLALETVAQKVIENAESDNLDAQFAVLAAANNILSEAENDDAKAKPIEDELERNADDKCHTHNAYMNGQARIVEDRYNEMRADPLFLYRDYRTTPHPNGYGSWNGHQQRYTYEQGLLNQKILDAFFAGCPETAKATEWKNKPAPQKPNYAL